MNKNHVAVSVVSLVLSALFANSGYAVDAQSNVPASELNAGKSQAADDDQGSHFLKEMVVSADKDKPVQQRTELGKVTVYTPVSGAVVGRQELDDLQLVNNLLELGKRVPGISMVRNMRVPDGGKQYTETRVDGLRATALNTSGLDGVDVGTLERIDVITGPASALYGSGALGGTISATTRQPPEDFAAKLSQEFGNWGFKRTQGNAGTTVANGRIGLLVTGSKMDYDGWRHNNAVANQNAAAERKYGNGVRMVVKPAEATKITFGYDQLYYDYRWAGPISMTKYYQDWRQTEDGTFGRSMDSYGTTLIRLQQFVGERGELTLNFGQINDTTINYGSAGSGGTNNVICDDGGALAAPLAAGKTVKCRAVNANSAAVSNTLKAGFNINTTRTAMYRHELDFLKTTVHVGTDIYETVADSATYNNVYTALEAQSGHWGAGTLNAAGSSTIRRESTPFVHIEISPIDKLRLHLGERFARVTDVIDDRTATNKDVLLTKNGNVIRSGATYEFNADHLVWSNIGQTFNPPGTASYLDTAAKGSAGNTIGAILQPEKGLTKEIGFRGKLERYGLQYDIDWYQTHNKNVVYSRTCTAAEAALYNLGITCNINENIGQTTLKGYESMFNWTANPWLDVGGTYTNARSYYDYNVSGGVNLSGNDYQAMPRHRLNLRATVKPAHGWKIELEGDHISKYYTDTANSNTYLRPDLYTLRASYKQSKNWSFWLHVLNLTNAQYATRVANSTIAGVSVLAASAGQGNSGSYTPRNLRAGVALSF